MGTHIPLIQAEKPWLWSSKRRNPKAFSKKGPCQTEFTLPDIKWLHDAAEIERYRARI